MVTISERQKSDISIAFNNILMYNRMISTGKFEGHKPEDIFSSFNENAEIVNNILQFPVLQVYYDIDNKKY